MKINFSNPQNISQNENQENSPNSVFKSFHMPNIFYNNLINAKEFNQLLTKKHHRLSNNEPNTSFNIPQISNSITTSNNHLLKEDNFPKIFFQTESLKPVKDNNFDFINPSQMKNKAKLNNKLIKPIFFDDSKKENEKDNEENEEKDEIKDDSNKIENKNLSNKFKVLHCKGKLNLKYKHKRKYKPDDIRKKIKARFHKAIKNIINTNLKEAGSKYFFSFLPQIFISSISREINHEVLNMTYKEILKKNFLNQKDGEKYKNKSVDTSKYKNNLFVLDYLEKHPDISERSGFDVISKMKYADLLNEYFCSKEFEKAVNRLREENEEEDYIKEYVNKAKTYVKFFQDLPAKYYLKKEGGDSKEESSLNVQKEKSRKIDSKEEK